MTRLVLALAIAAALVTALASCGGSSGGSGSTGSTESTGTETTAEGEPPTSAFSAPIKQALAEAAASGVPVRIPVSLLEAPPPGAEEAEVLRSPPDSYTLGLTKSAGCHLRSTCTAAIFSGFTGGGELTGRKVKLAGGIDGVYEPGRCGSGCSFGTVEWLQAGNRYGVAVARESTGAIVQLANEAIAAPPLPAGG